MREIQLSNPIRYMEDNSIDNNRRAVVDCSKTQESCEKEMISRNHVCFVCGAKFSWKLWKYNCETCQNPCCSECSPLKSNGRVCKICFLSNF